jgi:hypothetical protein
LTRTTSKPVRSALVCVAALTLLSAPAPAQRTPGRPDSAFPRQPVSVPRALPAAADLARIEVDPRVRALVDGLGDPDYARRETAMQMLLDTELDVAQLCVPLADTRTTPEQRYRLLTVLKHHLRDAPRGAVGIRMLWRQEARNVPGAVEITELLDNMPAQEVLRTGDQITHVDGNVLHFQNDLLVLVQSKRPGDAVELTVQRARRDDGGDVVFDDQGNLVRDEVKVTLRLGSAEQLRDPVTGQRTSGTVVDDARAREVRSAAQRYGPRPRVVEIEGAVEAGVIVREAPVTTDEVERHQVIRNMLEEQSLIRTGRVELTPERRAAWRRQLQWIQDRATQPGLSPRDRELLLRVAERFTELIRE